MDEVFDVFVIGPMGADKNDPTEVGTPISEHMINIASALRAIMPTLPISASTVVTPQDGGSQIEGHVFNQIDRADLAVADISGRSPSVMYELAYFHALGTPVIIIDKEQNESDTTPFYLKGANIVRVPDFSVTTLTNHLGERIRMFFNPKDDQDFSLNPITNFYAAPLVEVSGAASIARGYFWNMISGVLNSVGGVVVKYPKDQIKSFTVIEPSPEFQINEDLRRYGEAARIWNKGVPLKEKSWKIPVAARMRGLDAYFINGHVYDYPRTINMLNNSPRLLRLTTKNKGSNAGTIDPEISAANKTKVVKKLIHIFFETIEREMIVNEQHLFPNMYRRISLEQFEKELSEVPKI